MLYPFGQVNLVDHFDNHWVTCFQESAETILGIKADELGDLRENVSKNMRLTVCVFNFKKKAGKLVLANKLGHQYE